MIDKEVLEEKLKLLTEYITVTTTATQLTGKTSNSNKIRRSLHLALVLSLVYNGVERLIKMSRKVNIHEAKTHFSKLLARVKEGEEIIIAKAGKPVARLVPIKKQPEKRVPGSAKGKITIAPDFDAPLSDSVLELFEK